MNEAKNSTIPADDVFSSPFVEEDAEWFRNIFDQLPFLRIHFLPNIPFCPGRKPGMN